MKIKIGVSFLLVIFLLVLSGCGCKKNSGEQYKVSLEIWGPLDDSYTYSEIFEVYKKVNPQVREITYKKLTVDTYKKELLEALASGQGPDIFLIHNTWLPSFSDKVVAAPTEIITEQKFKQDFVDVCSKDFMDQGSVWAVPLSVDSLGLYYNKDLFNEAGIATPPRDWNEFINDVQKLTKISNSGEITQSGAALGTAYNINRSTDVLNLLFMQSGTSIVDAQRKVVLDEVKTSGSNSQSPAQNALNFYSQFARSGSSSYSWNPRLHYSIDSFSEGTLAMMFNYSWHIQTIRDKSPKLNFAVASIPQFPGGLPLNYANYWGLAVTKNKLPQGEITNEIRTEEAWKLLKFLTAKPEGDLVSKKSSLGIGGGVDPKFDPAATYLEKTGKPAARRDIIEKQLTDSRIGIFAKDNLIAQSWYQKDPEAMEIILAEVVDQVNKGQITVSEAIELASQRFRKLNTN